MPVGNYTASVAVVDGFELWRSQVRSIAASYQDQNTGAYRHWPFLIPQWQCIPAGISCLFKTYFVLWCKIHTNNIQIGRTPILLQVTVYLSAWIRGCFLLVACCSAKKALTRTLLIGSPALYLPTVIPGFFFLKLTCTRTHLSDPARVKYRCLCTD